MPTWLAEVAKRNKLVEQDADGIWLAASFAKTKVGLTGPQLSQRAAQGELRSREDFRGREWFHEEDIAKLAKERLAAEHAEAAKPKRKLSDAALEAQHTRA